MRTDQFDTRHRDVAGSPRRARRLILVVVLAVAAVATLVIGQVLSSDDTEPVADAPSSDARAASALGLPDAADAAVVEKALDDGGAVYRDGARLPLDAEKIWCALPPGSGTSSATDDESFTVEVATAGLAYTDAVTAATMAGACTSTGIPTPVELDADDAVVCAADRAWLPVMTVLLDGRSCADADVRPAEDDDLARINQARAVEVRLLAVPTDDGCATLEEAMAWAEARSEDLPTELAVRPFDEGPGCYRPGTFWGRGEILVQLLGPQPQ